MSDSLPEPDWSRLPRDPVGFFGLGSGFDRRDLKRAYNALLRIYKPEKHPDEFQRIRAAYEQLDERLRYGRAAEPYPTETPEWREDSDEWELVNAPSGHEGRGSAAGFPSHPPSPVPPVPRPKSLAERLETESPAAIYYELEREEAKAPYHYYALALLSDGVTGDSKAFARWLLEGIKAFRDGVLLQLLYEYFRGPQEIEDLLTLLPRTAEVLGDDSFYAVTEPAWKKVLNECGFIRFRDTLTECESKLRDSEIQGRITFLIQMLRVACWRGGATWAKQQIDYINANFEQIPRWLEWDVDLLGAIYEYYDVRERFRRRSPLRERIDQAISDYFCLDQQAGDKSVVACQLEILSDTEQLLEAFEISDERGYRQFYPLWCWITHDVAQRQGNPQQQDPDDAIWTDRAKVVLAGCVASSNWGLPMLIWGLKKGFFFVGIAVASVLVAVAVYLVVGLIADIANPSGQTWNGGVNSNYAITAAMLALLPAAWLNHWWLMKYWWSKQPEACGRKCYYRHWRRDILAFQRRSHLPDHYFRGLFAHLAPLNETTQWINHFVQKDFAPAVLAQAQRFEL